ncbi:helicase-related protein [Noviherbaspirillum galbum]|uniref:Helicase C-terminal domain-containing protein n=1 Tax=Noviherbaspirillum galbum TaxID=2709383 RepID=A0A6B3SP11_9BURK|nr:helicase-related protein [Noviherbaspirillum galbum]NEX62477.1 hypothetical protein [Noviherbaspirillum galbum]
MNERSELIAWIRGELVGPGWLLGTPRLIDFNTSKEFIDSEPNRRGPLAWRPDADSDPCEVLYYDRETPHRKYGAGLLHPADTYTRSASSPDAAAAHESDTLGVDGGIEPNTPAEGIENAPDEQSATSDGPLAEAQTDDFEVTSPDTRSPSTMGITFCATLAADGMIVINIPREKRFAWQTEGSSPFPLNGRYEQCTRRWTDDKGHIRDSPMWRRRPAVLPDTLVTISRSELVDGRKVSYQIPVTEGCPMALRLDAFPRAIHGREGSWLITVVLRNSTLNVHATAKETVLYQAYFETFVKNGTLDRYPESQRPFSQLDQEEQSLSLLYRESATWGIGHGCAAGWDSRPGETPDFLYADVMPAVELPSMTADIVDADGKLIELSMRTLAGLPESGEGEAWNSLENLLTEYQRWVENKEQEAKRLPSHLVPVAERHILACRTCLRRIEGGIKLLRQSEQVRRAFRLTNLAMVLQQVGTKQLDKRPLEWHASRRVVMPASGGKSAWKIYAENGIRSGLGTWRAFQIAFLLMSLAGVSEPDSEDREIVDLIWFPTGGGKTEAYLGVMAFYMFHERLIMEKGSGLSRDGTNVLMRYTLRMLTTQQFQRAAALICAMEYLRRHPDSHNNGKIPGQRFSLGLWIGGDGSPNKISEAKSQLGQYKKDQLEGNPLVLIECPWCRAAIGRYDGIRPAGIKETEWNAKRLRGIGEVSEEGPLLLCSDPLCEFGGERHESWLPVEVIDERIYRHPPSLIIATADKFAMVAYRPAAGAIFGRTVDGNCPEQVRMPPGLIVQDELHLISGPLGTMCALYEGIFERLCSIPGKDGLIRPKLIASTATIRGADEQVKALYDRRQTSLFPSPGLLMGDSFFGRYARQQYPDGVLMRGRLYLGIHASDYGSILTTQVRAFSSALFRPFLFAPDKRDAWWTVLAFYNSIRELSGAKTLFDSDIRSRLKFLFNREGIDPQKRRNLRIVEELTSRLSQAEIVGMMDKLSNCYSEEAREVLDACLASNIIEVGVDIDRLSLMGVIGQPKTTAQYIQVTGRIGRRWWERPGLILTVYNPSKSRDRSHFEQFHSYHRRLYERVEPTSATPFAISAIRRGLAGAMLTWARQQINAPVQDCHAYGRALDQAVDLLVERCGSVQIEEDVERSIEEIRAVANTLKAKWGRNPQKWEEFPPQKDGEYLMLWPGQFATQLQQGRGMVIPSSMRQVDGSAELTITPGYTLKI